MNSDTGTTKNIFVIIILWTLMIISCNEDNKDDAGLVADFNAKDNDLSINDSQLDYQSNYSDGLDSNIKDMKFTDLNNDVSIIDMIANLDGIIPGTAKCEKYSGIDYPEKSIPKWSASGTSKNNILNGILKVEDTGNSHKVYYRTHNITPTKLFVMSARVQIEKMSSNDLVMCMGLQNGDRSIELALGNGVNRIGFWDDTVKPPKPHNTVTKSLKSGWNTFRIMKLNNTEVLLDLNGTVLIKQNYKKIVKTPPTLKNIYFGACSDPGTITISWDYLNICSW